MKGNKNSFKQLLWLLALGMLFSCAVKPPVKIAFLGDSITIGSGLENANEECYPSQFNELLQEKFGDQYVVNNFAVSGRTMLRHGDRPLWNEPQFTSALEFKPDVVYIMLGTNDTKPQNWDEFGNEFAIDYQAMLDTFKVINPDVQFILAFPPPAFKVQWGIRDSVIVNGVNPALDVLIRKNKTYSIDYYQPLKNSSNLFPDAIHPNTEGAKEMATLLYDFFIHSTLNK
ncbi:MAG: GDSL-type esterase/lipase family protein [Prolixibacteraceae bacterium]